MTYQRNMGGRPIFRSSDEPLDERLHDEVDAPEVQADDGAGDDDDHRAGDDLLLTGPLDLLELRDALADEADHAAAVVSGVCLRLRAYGLWRAGVGSRRGSRGPAPAAAVLAVLALLLAALAAGLTGRPGH